MIPQRACAAFTLGAVLSTSLLGCGRRATAADCRLIVDKSVELQLQQMKLTDPDAVRKREQQVTSELQGELESCEGRRVTDRTMACVQKATAPAELEQCLR